MKDIATRNRVWGKPADQMDVWLDAQGFYRKHTARDGTCLFRAVSEQLFLTQAFHTEVRRHTMDYMLRHSDEFQNRVICPLEEYIEKMQNPREWGGKLEIEAMAKIYKYDFFLYQEIGKPPEAVTQNGFEKKTLLCFSQERHYDSVYTKDYICDAAFCQSILYGALYKNVFDLKEVDYAVNKMLHDKTSRYQRDQMSILNFGFPLRFEMRDGYLNVKELLDIGITPFPYKVAKSLDPEVYRNVEFDTWNDYRKGLRYGLCAWNCHELQVGVKCLVKLDESTYHGHIQEMQPNKGPVVVFIEELGEKMTVPHNSLELLPLPSSPTSPTGSLIPLKFQPLPITLAKSGKKTLKCSIQRSKNKEMIGDAGKPVKCMKDQNRELQSLQASEDPSLEYFEQESDYPPEILTTYPQQPYVIQRCEGSVMSCEDQVCPDSTKPPGMETNIPLPLAIPLDACHYPHYAPAPSISPLHQPPLNIPGSDINSNSFQPSPQPTINLMAPKSMNTDGSDLPHTDIPTLRFFYNLGLDHLRMNCVVRPGPPYCLNAGVIPQTYVPIDNSTPTIYEQPRPMPTTTPVIEHRRPEYLSYQLAPLPSSESDASQLAVQPRTRNEMNHTNIKRNINTFGGAPLIQQNEVSSSNIGMSTPISPIYYQQGEFEPYCMSVSYVDYSMYDYSPVYPPSPHTYSPSSYVNADGVFYQQILPPGVNPTPPGGK